MQSDYLDRMVKSLPLLRAATGLTQAQLGKKIGMSRQTIVAIENKKRPLPWCLFLAMVCVFQQYEESMLLLVNFELFDAKFIKEII